MAKPLVSDELWALVEPLIPTVERRYRFPGRKRIDDRKVLTGILYVLRTGIPWEYLPQEMGCGSGMTSLATVAGVAAGRCLAAAARSAAGEAAGGRPDRLVAGGDRQLARAGRWGGEQTGPSPVDRARSGSKHHTLTCGVAPRSRSRSRPATATTSSSCCRSSMRSRRCAANVAGPVGGRNGCSAMAPTTPAVTAKSCAPAGSAPRSPGRNNRTAQDWAVSAGSSSARSAGCTSTGAYASATNAVPTSTTPSSRSPAP